MGNIQSLKDKNRLEEIVEEFGYLLDHKTGSRYWTCQADSSLSVDLEKQRYYWGSESGDVISWLRGRLGWEMSKALQYLRYRPSLAINERPRMIVNQSIPENGADFVGAPAAADPGQGLQEIVKQAWAIDDNRVTQALRLGFGFPYPGGIESLVIEPIDIWALFGLKNRLPHLFMPVVGAIPQDCTWCNREFELWEGQGQAYLRLQMLPGELLGEREYYCKDCVRHFRLWYIALDLLICYQGGLPEISGYELISINS